MKTLQIFAFLAALACAANVGFATAAADANVPCIIYDSNGQPLTLGDARYLPCSGARAARPTFNTDDVNMVQIGTLVAPMYNTMSGGDSDEDGFFEAYMYIKDNQGGWSYTYRIYENDGQNNYPQAFQADAGMIPYAFGDQDGDGLPEVIGQWSYWVYVYESPGPGHLATQMVWQSPQMTNVTGYTAIGDLDQDGLAEIIHTQNSFGSDNRLIIFETTGDNQFQEIVNQWVSNSNLSTKAIGDFDGDGLMEVAFCSGGGDVYVFESSGNNAVQQTYQGTMNTWNAYACSYADDMDGNGRPEFICGGSDSNQGWVTQVYEADGNDSYVVRQEIIIWDGYFGVPGNAVGDLDGDGVDEFVIQTAQALHVYEWDGFQYSEVQNIPENFGSILHGVFSYDGNYNGYDELFWLGIGDGGYWTNETILLEDEAAAQPPDVTVTLTPESLPIVIPANGGSFNYNVAVANEDSVTASFDAWIMVTLPDSSQYGPVLGPVDLTLPGGESVNRDRTQSVPAGAPPGNYTYTAYVGVYPDVVWDSSSFPFEKLTTGEGAIVSDWINEGEDFEGSLTTSMSHVPVKFDLLSVHPNPFNPTTTLTLTLPEAGMVKLEVFDISGRSVGAGFKPAHFPVGAQHIFFDGSNLPSGIYFARLTAGEYVGVKKMVLMK